MPLGVIRVRDRRGDALDQRRMALIRHRLHRQHAAEIVGRRRVDGPNRVLDLGAHAVTRGAVPCELDTGGVKRLRGSGTQYVADERLGGERIGRSDRRVLRTMSGSCDERCLVRPFGCTVCFNVCPKDRRPVCVGFGFSIKRSHFLEVDAIIAV